MANKIEQVTLGYMGSAGLSNVWGSVPRITMYIDGYWGKLLLKDHGRKDIVASETAEAASTRAASAAAASVAAASVAAFSAVTRSASTRAQ